MSIGLDLGSTQFRSLRRQDDRLVGRLCRLEYTPIPDSVHHRRLLDRDRLSYAECDGTLILMGDDANEWGHVLRTPITPLLPDGKLPAHDPLSRQILSLMLDAVLPPAQFPSEICCFTVPGELLPEESNHERGFFRRLVTLRGYEPCIIGQGLAVVLAELMDAGFSGLGITLGATQCEFALVRSGREFARCAIPWGTAELVAWNEATSPIARRRDQTAEGRSHLAPAAISDSMIVEFLVELLLEAGLRIGQNDGFRLLTQPVSVACAGGLAAHPGFERLFHQAWQRAAWPITVRQLRIAVDAAYTVARGCLIQAKLEARPLTMQAPAA